MLALAFSLLLAASPAIRAVEVPPALAAVTSAPELSGLAWSPSLRRYLVVSDDTGLEERGTQHAPMVFGLDEKGALDEAPIPIAGIASLNDPESICAGPFGTYFLATSHSPNRKGHTRADRRQLLHLQLRGRALAVLGRVDLTAVQGGRTLPEIAGVDPEGRLDIEAIGYRAGALFVGLKSPLAADGSAVILRLDDPAQATRTGSIRPGALSRWARLPLCGEAGNGRACQGLSDMVFLPDGSLVVAANAPKGAPRDLGGTIWWVRLPLGTAPPVLLQRFPGLKPEGIALSSKNDGLVVVFDRDREGPLLTELPLPGRHPANPVDHRAAH